MKNKRIMNTYKRNIHPFLNRLMSIWDILTNKEYILVKIIRHPEKKSRSIAVRSRTSDTTEGELLSLKAAMIKIQERNEKT